MVRLSAAAADVNGDGWRHYCGAHGYGAGLPGQACFFYGSRMALHLRLPGLWLEHEQEWLAFVACAGVTMAMALTSLLARLAMAASKKDAGRVMVYLGRPGPAAIFVDTGW